MARSEGVSGESGVTGTGRLVVEHTTLGIETASAGAWVFTLVIDTGFGQSTVGILYTLGSAALVGITNVIGKTSARSNAISFLANSIGSAGRWVAGFAG